MDKTIPVNDARMEAATVASDNEDDAHLSKMGYKPTLHRGLDALMNFAFGFTEVAVLASVCITLSLGLECGGPSVVIWGFVVNFTITMVVAHCMAEICSAYPSAGSVYHWAGQLAPEEWAPLWSYVCGWTNFLGNAAGDASFGNAWASFLSSALVAQGYPAISPYKQVGTSIAILFIWSGLNFFRVDKVGWVNNLAAFVHAASIIIIIISILVKAPQLSTGHFVFTDYYNDTGFESKSYVGALGITAALFSFAGYEASAHMAEETGNSAATAPKGIINTCWATGWGGLALILAFLFAMSDTGMDDAINGATGTAASQIFLRTCGDKFGAGLTWLVVINLFFAGVSSVTVTGRITWALTRDGAFPFSSFLSQVHGDYKSPINAILFVFVWDALLMLLPLDAKNGATAFYSIVGLCTIGFQISYGIPIMLKHIYPQPNFPQTPMSLGSWSLPMGILSVSWLFGTSVFFFFPTGAPVGVESMNWLVVVVGGVIFMGALNWVFNSKYHFRGPPRSGKVAETATAVPIPVPVAAQYPAGGNVIPQGSYEMVVTNADCREATNA